MTTPLPPLVCGSCTACCYTPPFLDDGEATSLPTLEDWNAMRLVWQRRFFAAPSGACMYLDPAEGCAIYDQRPAVCRRFDCRTWYRSHNRSQRRGHTKAEQRVFAAAKERGA